jgi:DNA-directed RNA polymerase subunit RPC12/RpoP
MKRFISTFLFGLIVCFGLVAPVLAQSAEFRLHAQRDFGYNSGRDVRGNFTLSIIGGQETIQSVTFFIDGKIMSDRATVSQPPFKYSFRTTDFPNGVHQLIARVSTKDGRTAETPPVTLNFLSGQQQSQAMAKIIVPLMIGIAVVLLISVGVQYLLLRNNPNRFSPGAPRNYGIKGGTICPKCGRPYAIHLMSVNLPGGTYDRCDYCGKRAFVRRRSPRELQAAEQAELEAAQASENSLPGAQNGETETDRLRKMLDESKYTRDF